MHTPDKLGLLSVVALLAGCATSSLDLAPVAPDVPWTPTTRSDGEIVAGATASATAPRSNGYVLPSNAKAAGESPAPADLDKSHSYTLAELIDLAQSHNPSTRVAWENAREAALASGIAKAAYLPSVSASVVGAYQTGSNSVTVPGTQGNLNGSLHGVISAVSVQWLLFDFGERDAMVSAAEQVSVIANIGFTAAHQQLIYKVALAYYTHIAAQARVGTAEKALRNAKEVQAAAESRYDHGVGTSVEVAQARQVTAQGELAHVQASGQAQDSYVALLDAMGISPLAQIKVADQEQRKLSAALTGPVDQIVAEALARRPDVLTAYAAHEASLAKLRAAQAEFMPKVFLSATGSYASNVLDVSTLPGLGQGTGQVPPTLNIPGTHFGATVLLGLTVPIYDGGVRRALEGQARADEAKTDARLEQIRDEATREIVGAANRVRTGLSALDAADALASASRITFDAALDAYRNGVGSITDTLRAETALLEAQNASTDAYSAALSSAATLALAAGTLGTAPQ
jgi:outer membrane protein TolC